MGLLNDINREWDYEASQINWSIGYESDEIADDGYPVFVETNKVGSEAIGEIPDGEYALSEQAYDYKNWKPNVEKEYKVWVSQEKIKVVNGYVDIASAKRAVADVLNQAGTWHYFIEQIWLRSDGTIGMFLAA